MSSVSPQNSATFCLQVSIIYWTADSSKSMVVQTFNSRTQEVKASRSLWIWGQNGLYTQRVPDYQRLYSETVSQQNMAKQRRTQWCQLLRKLRARASLKLRLRTAWATSCCSISRKENHANKKASHPHFCVHTYYMNYNVYWMKGDKWIIIAVVQAARPQVRSPMTNLWEPWTCVFSLGFKPWVRLQKSTPMPPVRAQESEHSSICVTNKILFTGVMFR